MKNEIIVYQSDEISERLEVRVLDETVWLTRQQMAFLFGRDVKTIGKHVNNIFNDGELDKNVAVAFFATTTRHGAIKGKTQSIETAYYNLDVIISVGYRVKSKQGIQFRIWATQVLKDYMLKGYAINNRMNRLEDKVEKIDSKINKIDLQLQTQELPTQGIFFEGQIFDAYEFASKLIRSAKEKIILIDNYIDESTLITLAKKNENVKVILLTKNISKQLELDVEKLNAQYKNFELRKFEKSHDRFLIIDTTEVYHLGASLKDLGKKWFAFSKLYPDSVENILKRL